MARALWKGSISFGLVTIPVSLYPAKAAQSDIRFNLLHKTDMRPVRNKRWDDEEHEVPWEEIVKGYEYEPDRYVVIGEEELKAAGVEATQSVDIMHFVDASAIDPAYYDTPYYTEPTKAGRKAYALLRETLKRTGKVGVARVVIRTRQHLCALRADGPMLVVAVLRWPYQLRDAAEFDLPDEDLSVLGVSGPELAMAEQLVDAMTAAWAPSEYTDTYRDAVMRIIEEKATRGEIIQRADAEGTEGEPGGGQVVDIMELLKRSLEKRA
jgi:DNA end-binding protein Ku